MNADRELPASARLLRDLESIEQVLTAAESQWHYKRFWSAGELRAAPPAVDHDEPATFGGEGGTAA